MITSWPDGYSSLKWGGEQGISKLSCSVFSITGYFYALWDSGDNARALSALNYYKNIADAWLKKYNFNQYYNYFASLASSYYTNLISVNARQANYYKNMFLAYASYYYWMREGNAANAAASYKYYADLAKTFS